MYLRNFSADVHFGIAGPDHPSRYIRVDFFKRRGYGPERIEWRCRIFGQRRIGTMTVETSAGPAVVIEILRGKAAARSRAMTGPTLLIGSGLSCDIQMRSAEVAPKHCILSKVGSRLFCRRLDPAFPAYVNGSPVNECELVDGDTLGIGPFELAVKVEQPPATSGGLPSDLKLSGLARAFGAAEADRVEVPAPRNPPVVPVAAGKDPRPSTSATPSALELELANEQRELLRQKEHLVQRERRLAALRDRLARRIKRKRLEFDIARSEREKSAAQVAARESELERSLAQLWRREDDLNRRQVELDERSADLDRRAKSVEDQEQNVAARQTEIHEKLAGIAAEQQALELLRAELEERQRQQTQAEIGLQAARYALEREIEQVRAREEDFTRRQQHIDAVSAQMVEREERHRAACQVLERDRENLARDQQELGRRDHQLAARALEIERSEAAAQERLERVRAQEDDTAARAHSLDEQIRQFEFERERMVESEGQLEAERARLEHREQEIQKHAQAIFDRFLEDQKALDARHQAVADETRQLLSLRAEVATAREQVAYRAAELARASAELTAREQIVRERLARMETAETAQQQQLDDLTRAKTELVVEQRQLEEKAAAVAAQQVESQLRAQSTQEESARLRQVAAELEARRLELAKRETACIDEARRRRAEIEHLANSLERRRALLERQSSAQGRHAERLRELALRLLARQPEPKSRLEHLERQHDQYRRRLEQARATQRRLLDEMIGVAQAAGERAEEAVRMIESLRAGHEGLAGVLGPSSSAQDSPTEWTQPDPHPSAQSLEHLGQALGHREQDLNRCADEIRRGQEQLGHLLAVAEQSLLPMTLPGEMELAAWSTAEPTDEGDQIADDELALRLMETKLIEAAVLERHVEQAIAGQRTLRKELLDSGRLTPYQLQCLRDYRADWLRLGPATILDILHVGTMGITYRARLPRYREPVALKVLDIRWCREPSLKQAFDIQTRALASFRHANVAAVLELLSIDTRFGIVSEYVDGVSLADLSVLAIPPAALARFCHQAVTALAAAQRVGFVHHNLRPSRLLVDAKGNLKIIGYGEPAWLSRIHRCEKGRSAMLFVPPEEAEPGGECDIRGDLYSLGQIFLELSAGSVARTGAPSPLALPTPFANLLLEMVETDPAARCRSVEEVRLRLESILAAPDFPAEPWPELPAAIRQIRAMLPALAPPMTSSAAAA